MNREIVKIDEEKCTGCGMCVPNCHEGALQIIDGKAVLISDLMCDGLGACLGHCPEGALEIITREASPYDETLVMAEMVTKSQNVVLAHLKHLIDHNEQGYLREGINYLRENRSVINLEVAEIITEVENYKSEKEKPGFMKLNITPANDYEGKGCPGSQSITFKPVSQAAEIAVNISSALTQWPVQMHLINPAASHFQESDFVLSADCVAYSLGNFHNKYLKGKTLGIACPKLDQNKDVYTEKIIRLIDDARINTLTVLIMEVPCCGGLLQLTLSAARKAKRKVPVKAITVGIQGNILSEKWM
ncbi:MAG: 4Fe-4S binding protein [Bacteroidales bacterium]|nr:4Fe-4S binding protein [Bacteroidales bacterium]